VPQSVLDTVHLHHCVRCWQAGDPAAADALFRAAGQRLEHLTRKMLRGFPAVHACTETVDVLQGSVLRLLQTLRRVEPESTRHFFNLAALHIRRELLDLARRFKRTEFGQRTATEPAAPNTTLELIQAVAAPAEDGDLDLWCCYHEAVEQLPPEEREVLGLVFYHGWTQGQIAELFEVNERTVRRRWQSACLRLHERLGKHLPRP
jgi:RNA polymerase sigma-70 factor (ECF subfamily)